MSSSNYQFHFEVYLKNLIRWLYYTLGVRALILVSIEARLPVQYSKAQLGGPWVVGSRVCRVVENKRVLLLGG